MPYQNVLVSKSENFVGNITLNRPDQFNTFSSVMAEELCGALWEMEHDKDVRVILIKGAGKGFSAGVDLSEMFGKTTLEYHEWVTKMERPLLTMSELTKPVVTQVHGPAVANGTGLVAASDLSVASEDARFGLTAIRVGLSCLGPVIPIIRLVGRKRALELLLGGEMIGAEEAFKMGLVNRVVPYDKLEKETLRLVDNLATKSPCAIRMSKKAFYAASEMNYRQAFEFMNEAFTILCSTEDAHEGVKAFLEKRQPSWKGR